MIIDDVSRVVILIGRFVSFCFVCNFFFSFWNFLKDSWNFFGVIFWLLKRGFFEMVWKFLFEILVLIGVVLLENGWFKIVMYGIFGFILVCSIIRVFFVVVVLLKKLWKFFVVLVVILKILSFL